MKKVQLLFLLLMLPLLSWAQTKVNASEVLAKINRGETVSYKNAEIVGDLDMTKLQNMKLKKDKSDKYSTQEHISTVTAPLTFTNCTFKGDVLAYFNPDKGALNINNSSNEVYNTNFERDVRFENCVFEKKSEFKYAEFKGQASFSGSRFSDEANFKYTKFSNPADYSRATFGGEANFKYVSFPGAANFSNATFSKEANFKYAKFPDGVNFQKATFGGLANFKYAKLADPMKLQGAAFKGGDDFKYTQLNNQKANLSALMERSK
ncbi:hypothetical protein OB13_01865 [Pontibacter sp. HJ8]